MESRQSRQMKQTNRRGRKTASDQKGTDEVKLAVKPRSALVLVLLLLLWTAHRSMVGWFALLCFRSLVSCLVRLFSFSFSL